MTSKKRTGFSVDKEVRTMLIIWYTEELQTVGQDSRELCVLQCIAYNKYSLHVQLKVYSWRIIVTENNCVATTMSQLHDVVIVILKIVTKYSGSFTFRSRNHIGDYTVASDQMCG